MATLQASCSPRVASLAPSRQSRVLRLRVQAQQAVRIQEAPAVASTLSPPVLQLSPETHQELIRGNGLVLVDYYTDWCGPCQLMHKELDKLTQAFPKGVAFAKFNCGHYEEFSTQQRIRSLPTFRLFKGGRCLEQVTGAKPVQLRQLLAHYCRP